jgi:hypothetical protein
MLTVAAAMAQTAGDLPKGWPPITSIRGTGDNFYKDGVTDEYDPRFVATFEAVYGDAAPDSLKVPFFSILGNHDHHGNASAQVAYKNSHPKTRFIVPALYWSMVDTLPNPEGGAPVTVQNVWIDTVLLKHPTMPADDEGPRSGVIKSAALLSSQAAAAEAQWQWIAETLTASTADFLGR